jgi:hypothetical protein
MFVNQGRDASCATLARSRPPPLPAHAALGPFFARVRAHTTSAAA